MQIIVDADSRRLSLGPTPPVRGETIPGTLTFMKGGVPFRLPAGTAIQIGLKSWNDPSDVLLAYTTATRPEPDGAPYTFSLSLNTSEMLAKFTAGVTRYDCSIEVKWEVSAGSGTFKKTQRHKYSVDADTVRDTDANPSTMLSRNDFLVTNGTGLLVNVAAGYAANGAFVAAQASLAITNATNYIEVTAAGVASVNTTAFTAGSYPLATVVASAGAITSNTDLRAWITPKPAAAGGGTGTVTSVAQSFTGGLISVAGSPITTSGTLALTVAGTSGGIPYFSSGTTWATSAALAASALVVGGGAGAAPATVTTGANVLTALGVAVGSAGSFITFNGNAGTPSALVGTNITGTAAGLTAGTVTTNANLTGHVTSVGNAAVLGSFTMAQLSTAVSDGDPAYVGAANTFTTGQTISATTSLLLGTAGSAVGNIGFRNATSGTTTLAPAAGALGTGTVTLPLSGTLATLDGTETLANKRITQRTGTATSSATPTINTDNVDFYSLTAQAADITSFTTNLSGTPTEGQTLWIAITGTAARAITWGATFEAGAVALPTTTVTTTRLDVAFVWNTVSLKWRCMASG